MPRALLTFRRENDQLLSVGRDRSAVMAYAVLITSGDVISFPLAGRSVQLHVDVTRYFFRDLEP